MSSEVKKKFAEGNIDHIISTPLKDGNMFIAYTDNPNEGYGTYMIVNGKGDIIKPKTVFHNKYTSNKSCVTLDDGNIFLVYADTEPYQGVFMVLSPSGEVVIPKTVFNSSSIAYTRSVFCTKLNNGNVLIAYSDGGNSYYGTFVIVSPDGTIVKSKTVFNSGSTQYISCATFNDGKVLIVYSDGGNSNRGMFVIVDENGNITKSETQIATTVMNLISCTSLKNGNVFVGFRQGTTSGRFSIFNSSGTAIKSSEYFDTATSGIDYINCETFENGNVLITYRDGANSNSVFTIMDENGNVVLEKQVFETNSIAQIDTSIFENGDIFIAYRDYITTSFASFKIIVTDLINKIFAKNTLNNIEIDTLLQNGFYELLYDDKFIAKEVRV